MPLLRILLFAVLFLLPGYRLSAQASIYFTPAHFETQVFAHRGGYATGPENTLHTVMQNIRRKITAIEIDLQLTKDNRLILFHDDTISRLLCTDARRQITDMTWEELKTIPLRDSSQGKMYVTLFADLADSLFAALPEIGPGFILELDFKPHGDALAPAVNELQQYAARGEKLFGEKFYNCFYISTFYPSVLKYLHKHCPHMVYGFAVNSQAQQQRIAARAAVLLAPFFVKRHHATVMDVNICRLTPRYVKRWHRRHVLVNAYTANTACEKEYIRKLQVAYTTNCPQGVCSNNSSDQMGKPVRWCKTCSR